MAEQIGSGHAPVRGMTGVAAKWKTHALAWLGPGQGITSAKMAMLFCVVLLAIFSRRPGDLLHPCFYAEDGTKWYADAYNLHWNRALLLPYASYLQVLPRLAAGVSLLLPLQHAPLFLNLVGALLQALPVVVLLSSRASPWGPLPLRAAMAVVYLVSPGAREVHVNITNAQWHLALLQILLALGTPPGGWLAKIGDVAVFVLGALSGPFGLVLLPVLLLSWYWQRQRWVLILAACMLPGVLMQAHTLVYGAAFSTVNHTATTGLSVDRLPIPLGASPRLFVRIVGNCVFLDSMIGHTPLDKAPTVVAIVFFLIGACVVATGLRYGGRPMRLLALYTAALFTASLISPLILGPVSRWESLSQAGGGRYFFFPMLVYLWSALVALWNTRLLPLRRVCLVPLCLLVPGLGRWVYKPFPPVAFAQSVERFQRAPIGQPVQIAIDPVPWQMVLEKH